MWSDSHQSRQRRPTTPAILQPSSSPQAAPGVSVVKTDVTGRVTSTTPDQRIPPVLYGEQLLASKFTTLQRS